MYSADEGAIWLRGKQVAPTNVIVQFVSKNKGALGYFGLAYYEENKDKLNAVPVKATDTAPAVLPSVATVNDGTYQPLARPLFIYVNAKSIKRPEVKQFVDYYLEHAAELTKEVGYIDLPAAEYEQAKQNFNAVKVGTGFGGVPEVGVRIADLLKREGKSYPSRDVPVCKQRIGTSNLPCEPFPRKLGPT